MSVLDLVKALEEQPIDSLLYVVGAILVIFAILFLSVLIKSIKAAWSIFLILAVVIIISCVARSYGVAPMELARSIWSSLYFMVMKPYLLAQQWEKATFFEAIGILLSLIECGVIYAFFVGVCALTLSGNQKTSKMWALVGFAMAICIFTVSLVT